MNSREVDSIVGPEIRHKLTALSGFAGVIEEFEPDIIFLGDSVIDDCVEREIDKSPIDTLLASQLSKKVISLHRGTFSFFLYQYLFQWLPCNTKRQCIVVMEFNLRSLSDHWFIRPVCAFSHFRYLTEYHLRQRSYGSLLYRYHAYTHSDLLIRINNRYRAQKYDMAIISEQNTIGDLLNAIKTNQEPMAMEFYYCYNNRKVFSRIKVLLQCVRLLQSKGYQPLVYLTPVDYELIKAEVGAVFLNQYRQNLLNVAGSLRKVRGLEFLDFNDLLHHKHFKDAEHLLFSGRERLAKELAQHLAKTHTNKSQKQLRHVDSAPFAIIEIQQIHANLERLAGRQPGIHAF